MKLVDLATAAVFSLFVAAPVGSVLMMGYDPASDVKETVLPPLRALVHPDSTVRNTAIKSVVSNSIVGIAAIRAKSSVDYDTFGFVNTERVISGADGWLFYKPDFNNGICRKPAYVESVLDSVEALRAVAEGAGKRLTFAVAPDKTTIYPTLLGPRAAAVAGCAVRNAQQWRAIASRSGSSVIDHLEALKANPFAGPLYYATDTHWNERGQALVLAQLGERLLGSKLPLPNLEAEKTRTNNTDLMSRYLRLPRREYAPTFGSFWTGDFKTAVGSGASMSLVIYDSFYHRINDQLRMLFPDAQMVLYDSIDPLVLPETVKGAQDILLSSVERYFFARVTSGEYGWSGTVGRALLEENRERAEKKCNFHRLEPTKLKVAGIAPDGGDAFKLSTGATISIPLPTGQPCLRVRATAASPVASRIYLPSLDPTRAEYRPGMSIFAPGNAAPDGVSLVLPSDYAGRTVKWAPVSDNGRIDELTVEVGTLTGN